MPCSTETISGWLVDRFDQIDSTSLHARRLVTEVPSQCMVPRLLIARRQSAGRGRLGRPWHSPEGGLWCTFIWPVKQPLAITPDGPGVLNAPAFSLDGLGLRIGVACTRMIEDAAAPSGVGVPPAAGGVAPSPPASIALKWPNDVLVNGKKILGVLTEAVARSGGSWILIGIGVNANFDPRELPGALQHTATTLRAELGRDIDLDRLTRSACSRLRDALNCPSLDLEAIDTARTLLSGIGDPVAVHSPDGAPIRGRLVGLSTAGRPIIRVHDRFIQGIGPVEAASGAGVPPASP